MRALTDSLTIRLSRGAVGETSGREVRPFYYIVLACSTHDVSCTEYICTCERYTLSTETPRPAAARRPRAPIIPRRSPYMAANRCVDGSPTALRAPAAPATVFSRSYSGGTTVGCVEVSCASPAPQEGASFLHSTRTRLYEYARAMRSSCRRLMCKLTPVRRARMSIV